MKKLLVCTLPIVGLLTGALVIEFINLLYHYYNSRFSNPQDALMASLVVVLGLLIGICLMIEYLLPDEDKNQGS